MAEVAIEDWAAGATIGGSVIPVLPDLARIRRERFGRLQAELATSGLDGLVLLGSSSVGYATGASMPALEATGPRCFGRWPSWLRGSRRRTSNAVRRRPAYVHGPLFPDLDEGMHQFAKALSSHFSPGARIGIDHFRLRCCGGFPAMSGPARPGFLTPPRLRKAWS